MAEATAAKKRKRDDSKGVSTGNEKAEKKDNNWSYPPDEKRQWMDQAKQPGKQAKLSILRAGRLIYYHYDQEAKQGFMYCTCCQLVGIPTRYPYDIEDSNAVCVSCFLLTTI